MSLLKAGVDYVSHSFDSKFLSLYKLVLSLADRMIVYALVNEANEVFLLKGYTNREEQPLLDFLDQVYQEDDLLKNHFKSCEIVVHAPHWMLVPAEFLTNGAEARYLESVFDIHTSHYYVHTDYLRPMRLHNLFANEAQFEIKCNYYFQNPVIRHVVSQVLNIHHALHHRLVVPASAHIELFEDRFIYTIFRDRELVFCNSYAIHGASDVLYFILMVNKVLEINPERLTIFQTGMASFEAEVQKYLHQYFRKVLNPEEYFFRQTSLNKARIYHHHYGYILLA